MDKPAAPAIDPRTIVGAVPAPRAPFDPVALLDGRRPPPPPVAAVAVVKVPKAFDPAVFLGESARRGAFDLSTVKPIRATVDGVDMVMVPASAYSDALRRIAAQETPAETVQAVRPMPDAAGMLDLLLSLHAAEVVSIGQLARATGLDHLDLGDRIAARAGAPFVIATEASEAHGAALDNGHETEAHGAAIDAAKPKRHPRRTDPVRGVP